MNVEIQTIPSFPAYCVTKDGRIWSKKNQQFLKPDSIKGYFCVSLYKDLKQYCKQISRLVLETFIGPCPDGMECCHNNGVRTDNRLKNLRWDTAKSNHQDAIKHETHTSLHNAGEKAGQAKLTETDVRMIIYMYRTKLFSQRAIAKIYNVCQATIGFIITKRNWKHIWAV